MTQRMRIAVLLSGGGTTLQNLIQWRDAGRLHADIGTEEYPVGVFYDKFA